MTYRTTIKPRFYAFLFVIFTGIALLLTKTCNDHTQQLPQRVPVIDSVLQPQQEIIDSLMSEIQMREATISQMRIEMQEVYGTVVKYVTKYRTVTDTVQRIIACDSLAAAAEVLAEKCAGLDSANQVQAIAYEQTINTYDSALDTCKATYNDLATDYSQSLDELTKADKKQKRLRAITTIVSSIAGIETVLIFVK